MMNDSRNDTWYQCVIGTLDGMDHDSTMTLQPTEWGNITILYVAGKYLMFSLAWLLKVVPCHGISTSTTIHIWCNQELIILLTLGET